MTTIQADISIPQTSIVVDFQLGVKGADGKGWTGGNYDPETGKITFQSNDGLGFETEDIRGTGDGDGSGEDGKGWTGGSYNATTGQVTFASEDGLGFTTGDLRGAQGGAGSDGADGADGSDGSDGQTGPGWTGGEYEPSTGKVEFASDDGLGFETGDLRGADGADGAGVPTGGTIGQRLRKTSSNDYETAWADEPAEIGIALGDEVSDIEVGTGVVSFHMPISMNLVKVRLGFSTGPVGAAAEYDLKEAGVSVLSSPVSVPSGADTATSTAISDTSLAEGSKMTVDCSQIGSTTAGAGPKLWLIGTRAA
ncbi:MAG: hypothetical protein AAGD22_09435 [Verrucomicrobiota bacterium]